MSQTVETFPNTIIPKTHSKSQNIKPLMWRLHEKTEKEEIWPKVLTGASLVYLEKSQKYVLIGGNFNALENIKKNFQLNRELIAGIDKNIENFIEFESKKIESLTDSVMNNSHSLKTIEIYVYDYPVKKWYKVASSGRVPKARSFHKCVAISKIKILICF